MEPIRTNVFKVSRYEVAMLGALEYVRQFWWFVLPVPLFGLIALVAGQGTIQVVGMIALLWPFSIPARAIASTGKAGKLFALGCHLEAESDRFVFYGQEGEGKRLRFIIPMPDVRDTKRTGRFLLIRLRRLGFAPVPVDAFQSADDEAELQRMVRERALATHGPL